MRTTHLKLAFLCIVFVMSAPLSAAEIAGRVAEVSAMTVKLTVGGDLLPAVGDEVEIFVMLPGLNEEARVATARVTDVGGILVVAGIRSATGQIEEGQHARFLTEKPVRRSEYRAPASGAGGGKAWIGAKLDVVRSHIAARLKLPMHTGVRIVGVFPGGPAESASLRASDILLKLAADKITGVPQFNALLAGRTVGEKVNFDVLRDGQPFVVELTLGSYPDDVESARGLRVAAERGEAWAQSELAAMYFVGKGVRKSDVQAVRLNLAAAEGGDMWAQANLGLRYLSGRGVAIDDLSALKWLRAAAEQGHAMGQNALGWMLASGRGTPRNDAEAVKWYQRSAENPDAIGDEVRSGSVFAQSNLADMYENGRGVAKDLNKAREWYRKAAEQGNAGAQFSLGRLYHDGTGVQRDYVEAMKWFHLAAQQKHAGAQTMMGLMILNGEGVKKNYQTAHAWLKLAVQQKNAAAQNALGVMYLNGWGVQKDEVEAFALLIKSSDQGYELAKKNLRDMGVEP